MEQGNQETLQQLLIVRNRSRDMSCKTLTSGSRVAEETIRDGASDNIRSTLEGLLIAAEQGGDAC